MIICSYIRKYKLGYYVADYVNLNTKMISRLYQFGLHQLSLIYQQAMS